jgi:hypothetical protein
VKGRALIVRCVGGGGGAFTCGVVAALRCVGFRLGSYEGGRLCSSPALFADMMARNSFWKSPSRVVVACTSPEQRHCRVSISCVVAATSAQLYAVPHRYPAGSGGQIKDHISSSKTLDPISLSACEHLSGVQSRQAQLYSYIAPAILLGHGPQPSRIPSSTVNNTDTPWRESSALTAANLANQSA